MSDPGIRRKNARPNDVKRLLYQGDTHETWFLANRSMNRFFIVNLDTVLNHLAINHTRTERYFRRAEQKIAKETHWPRQYQFAWKASHTQINPDRRLKPKQFGTAAAIIVALDVYAEEHQPKFNVYDYLRIIPAQYFIDRFDASRMKALADYFDSRDTAWKEEKLGADADKSFLDFCLCRIGQEFSPTLLDEMTKGHTVTKFVADELHNLINSDLFPKELRIGPVRSCGEDGVINSKLGTKNAAGSLRVPKRRKPDELPPCF